MKTVAALIVLLSLAVAPPRAAQAIVGGMPDGNAHPNVGLLAFDVDGNGPTPPFVLCSGAVISGTAFLTAAHCIAFAPGAEWRVTLSAGSPEEPISATGLLWDDFPFAVHVPVLQPESVAVHPELDLALLRFAPGTFAVEPVELPPRGLLRRRSETGADLTLVGYGTDAQLGPPRFPFYGHRRSATVRMLARTPQRLRFLQTLAGGGCYGDSGSPQLLDGVAVSVFSGGPTNCIGVARGQRLDTAEARAFLAPYVD